MFKWKEGVKTEVLPANAEELRVISKLFDILQFCCRVGVDFPCHDGKGLETYGEMKQSLLLLADQLEENEKS